MVDEIKAEDTVDDALKVLNTLREIKHTPEMDEVFIWLFSALEGDTEQREVDRLDIKQCKYAYNVIGAIHDCVTMVL